MKISLRTDRQLTRADLKPFDIFTHTPGGSDYDCTYMVIGHNSNILSKQYCHIDLSSATVMYCNGNDTVYLIGRLEIKD